MEKRSRELRNKLTGQHIGSVTNHEQLLAEARTHAASVAAVTEGIAVLSDFCSNICHTYAGRFGQKVFALAAYSLDESSPFEDEIFNRIVNDDLLERHILELRFFSFLRTLPLARRSDYRMSCLIRFVLPDGSTIPVLHNSRYLQWHENGAMWLGLCTYIPLPVGGMTDVNGIIDSTTGCIVDEKQYTQNDDRVLSKRQTEILAFLAKGYASKQIADKLNISVHTVNRHRQDILSALKVINTASAVEIGLRMHII